MDQDMRQFQAKSRWDAMLPYAMSFGAMLFGSMLLTGCAPQQNPPALSASSVVMSPDILVKRAADITASTEDSTRIAAVPDTDADRSDDGASDVATSVIDLIIWQIQTGSAAPAPPDPVIPQGQDPSLTEDALEAAFALLSTQVSSPRLEPDFILSAKLETELRIGLLVPLSGQYAALGDEIRRGAEMALFKTGRDNVTLLFLDTKGDDTAADAALTGVKNNVDIFIGPLFTPAVVAARSVAVRHQTPMLLLSNNRAVVAPDSWLMGYLPEQQLDGLLGHAVDVGKTQFAIIAQDAAFGQRLLTHATNRLRDFGLKPEVVRVLSNAELADEKRLRQAIREFTRYQPSAPDELPADSPFDAVIFAGDPEFALRAAPLLAYYDVGPDRALFLGNALWNQAQLLNEPSLQGGVFATRPSQFDTKFIANWSEIWQHPPGELSRLGFDAMALVAALVTDAEDGTPLSAADWAQKLVTHRGFQGYSGAFRLLPDGSNVRAYELRQIRHGQSTIIKPAPDRI
ncbi:penicillin-binding protein activator [Alphaproteobacteria bacterium]|nr:penicillin-binding protein activator [Alphaproteobacteria bacterium]